MRAAGARPGERGGAPSRAARRVPGSHGRALSVSADAGAGVRVCTLSASVCLWNSGSAARQAPRCHTAAPLTSRNSRAESPRRPPRLRRALGGWERRRRWAVSQRKEESLHQSAGPARTRGVLPTQRLLSLATPPLRPSVPLPPSLSLLTPPISRAL